MKLSILNNIIFKRKKQIFNTFKNNPSCAFKNKECNTVLLIEPRKIREIPIILANTYNKLGIEWNYVFYCGQNLKTYWKRLLPTFIEVRELDVDNFPQPNQYSDFCKKKELWKSLYGKYILTIQTDVWIVNGFPYNIDFFVNLDKSYIGGNMTDKCYKWNELDTYNIHENIKNFNGGLSLRNRDDMLTIINTYPPLVTTKDTDSFEAEAEDVYFVIGCYKLHFPLGNDEVSSHFAIHCEHYNHHFGIHNPMNESVKNKLNKQYPLLRWLNKGLGLKMNTS